MRYFLFFVFLLVNASLFAQSVPPLDRVISVDIRNATIKNALHQVSSAGSNATHHWGWIGFQVGLRYNNL